MKNCLKIVLISLSFMVSACAVDERQDNLQNVAFTEYSLSGTSCEWIHLGPLDNVIVINSEEELSRHITCNDEESCPDIDFSKSTLLLIQGACTNGIEKLGVKNFQMISKSKYRLNIEATLNLTDVAERWNMALITDKLSDQNIIELGVVVIKR